MSTKVRNGQNVFGNACRIPASTKKQSFLVAGLPQAPKSTFSSLRDSRKRQKAVFPRCGIPASIKKQFFLVAGLPQAPKSSFSLLRESRKHSQKHFVRPSTQRYGVIGQPGAPEAPELEEPFSDIDKVEAYVARFAHLPGVDGFVPEGHLAQGAAFAAGEDDAEKVNRREATDGQQAVIDDFHITFRLSVWASQTGRRPRGRG